MDKETLKKLITALNAYVDNSDKEITEEEVGNLLAGGEALNTLFEELGIVVPETVTDTETIVSDVTEVKPADSSVVAAPATTITAEAELVAAKGINTIDFAKALGIEFGKQLAEFKTEMQKQFIAAKKDTDTLSATVSKLVGGPSIISEDTEEEDSEESEDRFNLLPFLGEAIKRAAGENAFSGGKRGRTE